MKFRKDTAKAILDHGVETVLKGSGVSLFASSKPSTASIIPTQSLPTLPTLSHGMESGDIQLINDAVENILHQFDDLASREEQESWTKIKNFLREH